jgi:hypothetical protein
VGVGIEAEDAFADGVAVVVVVEEPAVDAGERAGALRGGFAEGGLDGFKLHGDKDTATAGNRDQRTENREQRSEIREQSTESGDQRTGRE